MMRPRIGDDGDEMMRRKYADQFVRHPTPLGGGASATLLLGKITKKVTEGASNGYWWVALYDWNKSPYRLIPDSNGSGSGWGNLAVGGTASYTRIANDPDNWDDSDGIASNTANSSTIFGLSDPPFYFNQATSCSIVLRCEYDTGSIGLQSRVVQSDQTTAITDWATISPPSVTFGNVSASPRITGSTTRATWNGAMLQLKTGAGSGKVSISAAYVKVSFTTNDATESADGVQDTGKRVQAYARLADVAVGAWVYLYKFSWGYEIINATCGS